jgi:hypothetical protein
MKPLTPVAGFAALLHVGRGRDLANAEVAAELAGGALCASIGILCGLIKTGAVDGPAMRSWLQSLYDELGPAERHLAYGFSLSQVIEALDAHLPTATPTSLPPLRGQH